MTGRARHANASSTPQVRSCRWRRRDHHGGDKCVDPGSAPRLSIATASARRARLRSKADGCFNGGPEQGDRRPPRRSSATRATCRLERPPPGRRAAAGRLSDRQVHWQLLPRGMRALTMRCREGDTNRINQTEVPPRPPRRPSRASSPAVGRPRARCRSRATAGRPQGAGGRATVGPRRSRLRDGDPGSDPGGRVDQARRAASGRRRRAGRDRTDPAPRAQRDRRACTSCGAPHSTGASFCWQCGQPILQQVPSDSIF